MSPTCGAPPTNGPSTCTRRAWPASPPKRWRGCASGPATPGWDPLERALLAAADELVADARIADATYADLSSSLDTQQLMDVVFTVGAYEVFAMVMRTFDVELDDDLLPYDT